jgi:hypothetical protein
VCSTWTSPSGVDKFHNLLLKKDEDNSTEAKVVYKMKMSAQSARFTLGKYKIEQKKLPEDGAAAEAAAAEDL